MGALLNGTIENENEIVHEQYWTGNSGSGELILTFKDLIEKNLQDYPEATWVTEKDQEYEYYISYLKNKQGFIVSSYTIVQCMNVKGQWVQKYEFSKKAQDAHFQYLSDLRERAGKAYCC